jgi:uncharacterized protein with FMN-binding domain
MKRTNSIPISPLRLIRRIIQTAAFILFPGLFITTFSAMKTLFTAIIGGSFSMAANAGEVILVLFMLLITAVMGRFFCGFLCSFGTMGDFFWVVGNKLKLRRPKISRQADRILKSLKYIVLIGIVLLGWILGVSLLSGTANPWSIFGMYVTFSGWSDLSAWISIGALLLIGIMAGSLYIERFFCRYLCPLGAVFAFVSRVRLFKIRKPAQHCGECRACTKSCSMGIPLYGMNVISDGECIDCMNCVEVCPRGNVKANPKPALAAVVAVTAMSGVYFAGNIASSAAAEQITAVEITATANSSTSGQYIDGVYTGSAAGYRGSTQVQVTVENGYITDVEVLSTDDDARFFNRVESSIISQILSSQNLSVDTVSGATFSSYAIIDAVTNALGSALSSDSTVSSSTTQQSAVTTEQATTDTADAGESQPSATTQAGEGPIELADGTYTGSGAGFRGETSVSVTVENGYITSIKVTDYDDDERYFSRAETTVINEILAGQTPDVDAVSGATYSSNSIMEAVAEALGIDFTAATPVGGRQGGHGRH